MSKIIDITNKRFGRWIVRYHVGSNDNHRAMWFCECDCGNTGLVNSHDLRSGHSQSCGCLSKQNIGIRSGKNDSGLKKLFRQYKKSAQVRNLSFELSLNVFIKLTSSDCFYCGVKPSKFSRKSSEIGIYIYNGIDRIDNKNGYELDNCVSCCESCNFLKKDLTFEDFFDRITIIYNNRFGEIYEQYKE
jgi:hypothetical protein